jgi:hypothetical protein
MKILEMIELLDESISIEAIGGEWKVKIFLILKNLNKLILNGTKVSPPTEHLQQENSPVAIKTSIDPKVKLLKKSSS